MKYNQPPGKDPGSAYSNGNASAGVDGDIVPGEAVEFPQRELVHLIEHAGITPTNADLEQVRKAIQAMIDAATGSGETSNFLLVDQARARLPIFPDVQTVSGKIGVTSPATGTVRVPAGVTFMHRGIFPVLTVETDFATAANKTYHLRWTPVGGFALKDLADVAGYNPGVLAENSKGFDSTYDDMLVARIVTSASNVATVTDLVNLDRLSFSQLYEYNLDNWIENHVMANTAVTLNWARTPRQPSISLQYVQAHSIFVSNNIGHNLRKFGFMPPVFSRYGIDNLTARYQDDDGSSGHVKYVIGAEA